MSIRISTSVGNRGVEGSPAWASSGVGIGENELIGAGLKEGSVRRGKRRVAELGNPSGCDGMYRWREWITVEENPAHIVNIGDTTELNAREGRGQGKSRLEISAPPIARWNIDDLRPGRSARLLPRMPSRNRVPRLVRHPSLRPDATGQLPDLRRPHRRALRRVRQALRPKMDSGTHAGPRLTLAMLKNTAIRRSLALLLVVIGAALMFLAPETWAGLTLLAIGILLEVVGIALRHRDSP